MLLRFLLLTLTLGLVADVAAAQERSEDGSRILIVRPDKIELDPGDELKLEARVIDAAGTTTDEEVFFFARGRDTATCDSEGKVVALKAGEASVVVRTARRQGDRLSIVVPVVVRKPPLERIEFESPPTQVFTKTGVRLRAVAFDVLGMDRDDVEVSFRTGAPERATVDAYGNLTAHVEGFVTITAQAEGLRAVAEVYVQRNPVATIEFLDAYTDARTGDVLDFDVVTRDQSRNVVKEVPVRFSFVAEPDDDLGPAATGQIEQDGRFVAESPGLYTIVATCGDASAQRTVRIDRRNVQRKLEKIGHGEVLDVHTSDLWVWQGVDGRDYAVTGTWGANGDAIFWDVTDPSKIERISTVTIDARTVNDVKVSEDGLICVLSREGASDRRNGIVMVDVANPREPKVISTFDEELTGGVHNVFIYQGHVYALSAGRRYDVIDIRDTSAPKKVGTFELDTPGHSIHDVWIVDGLAYSSNWRDGVQIVDVGNGVKEGSPAKPVKVASYAYPSGWNHAAFPFKSADTGKSYVIAGDETFPYGLFTKDHPTYPRGWFHFIDFTDLDNPKEVARYEVPEAGTHNLWVEGDVLYAAYYNGGVRVVDISGDLMGDLYRQGREIAWFRPTHPQGVVPNAPMVWGPQPHKGHIFFSDWNTGLWALKLADEE